MMKTTSLQMFGLLLSLLLLSLLLLLRQPWIRLLLASSEAAMEGMLRLAAFHTVATLSGSWLVAALLISSYQPQVVRETLRANAELERREGGGDQRGVGGGGGI